MKPIGVLWRLLGARPFFKHVPFDVVQPRKHRLFLRVRAGEFNPVPRGIEEVDVVEEENVSELEIRKLKLAFWLLDSDTINPEMDDVLDFTKTKSFSEAKKVVFKKLKEENLEKVYFEIEEPLIEVVDKMKERGIKVDKKFLKKFLLSI